MLKELASVLTMVSLLGCTLFCDVASAAATKEEKAAPVDVITMEVTPEEAEKLALAATEGKLQLALRNFSDTEDVLTRGTTVPMLLASYSGVGEVKETKAAPKKPVTPVALRPAEPEKFTVELIKGGKVSEVKVEGR